MIHEKKNTWFVDFPVSIWIVSLAESIGTPNTQITKPNGCTHYCPWCLVCIHFGWRVAYTQKSIKLILTEPSVNLIFIFIAGKSDQISSITALFLAMYTFVFYIGSTRKRSVLLLIWSDLQGKKRSRKFNWGFVSLKLTLCVWTWRVFHSTHYTYRFQWNHFATSVVYLHAFDALHMFLVYILYFKRYGRVVWASTLL